MAKKVVVLSAIPRKDENSGDTNLIQPPFQSAAPHQLGKPAKSGLSCLSLHIATLFTLRRQSKL